MPMKSPPHPGRSIHDACLEPLRLSVTDGAKVLGVARHTLSRLINGQAGISAEMASGLKRPGGRTPSIGCACRLRSTWRRRGSTKARSG